MVKLETPICLVLPSFFALHSAPMVRCERHCLARPVNEQKIDLRQLEIGRDSRSTTRAKASGIASSCRTLVVMKTSVALDAGSAQRLAVFLLVAVMRCRVEMAVADIERRLDRLHAGLARQGHAAEADLRNAGAMGFDVLHVLSPEGMLAEGSADVKGGQNARLAARCQPGGRRSERRKAKITKIFTARKASQDLHASVYWRRFSHWNNSRVKRKTCIDSAYWFCEHRTANRTPCDAAYCHPSCPCRRAGACRRPSSAPTMPTRSQSKIMCSRRPRSRSRRTSG